MHASLFLYVLHYTISMSKIVLDLHGVYNDGKSIAEQLGNTIRTAIEKKVKIIEIIPGKGKGQLRRTVIRFLQQPPIKKMYHRIEIDENNHGRLFVHFKH